MPKTGPQKYPPASLAYWWQKAFPGNAMESNVGVLHTTEGRTVPDYRGGRDAPNFTALPDIPNKKLRWFQHFDFDTSSRALMNLSGGVETNTANAVQIELVGTCDERNAVTWDGKRVGVDYIFWPDAPDWLLAELALFVKWAHEQHGVRLSSTVTWKAYKKGQVGGSYGANGVRLTGGQWSDYYGWLGHQHVPENTHGDPGDIDFARVLELARGHNPTPSEEDDMPTAQEIAREVWEYQVTNAATGKPLQTGAAIAWLDKVSNTQTEIITRQIAAMQGAITALATQLGQLDDVDTATVVAAVREAIAEAVIDVDVTVTGTPTPQES